MNKAVTREIDIMDLFVDWISHWKSLAVCIFIGLIVVGGYMLFGRNTSEESGEQSLTSSIPSIVEGTPLTSLTPEQISNLSIEDMEKFYLSEKDINATNEVIELNNEYEENLEKYEETKDSMEIDVRAEAFNYVANSKNIVEVRRSSLTPEQQIYYYAKLGLSSQIGSSQEDIVGEENSIIEKNDMQLPSKNRVFLLGLLVLVLHFIIVGCKYLFSNKIKHVDKLSSLTSIPEYTRIIDWDKIDSEKGINKLVNKARFGKMRRTSMVDAIEINSSAIIENMWNKKYNSVAVVGYGLAEDRSLLVKGIKNKDENILVKSIDSITYSVNGADDIVGVDAAIIAVRVGKTVYEEVFEELQSLRGRDVDVIGVAVFE